MVQDGDAPDYADKDRDLDIEPGTILMTCCRERISAPSTRLQAKCRNLESFRMGNCGRLPQVQSCSFRRRKTTTVPRAVRRGRGGAGVDTPCG
ncbi:hypothetical protein KCP75_04330 [Salmonella enterica subsp. enterica]|nr:hypothetical protein KCP75_04330 [Salmonella enterica subsp. enterica]